MSRNDIIIIAMLLPFAVIGDSIARVFVACALTILFCGSNFAMRLARREMNTEVGWNG